MSFKAQSLLWSMIITIIAGFLYLTSDILFPFFVALLIAYFFDPLVTKLECKIPRSAATLAIIALFYLLLIIILIIILPRFYQQIIAFTGKIPQYKILLETKALPYIANKLEQLDPQIVEPTKKAFAGFSGNFTHYIVRFLTNIWQSGMALVNILSLAFLTPIITFYLLRDFKLIQSRLSKLLPVKVHDEIIGQLKIIDNTISGYVRGQTNVCLIMAIYYALSLSFIGLDSGLFIGIATGFLTVIPYIGLMVGFIVALITGIFQFGELHNLFILLAIFLVGQVIESNFISPKLVGDRIGLHPAWMIFAMMAGATLFGFYGVLLATPVAAIINIIVKYCMVKYLESGLYQ
jgi:predicted PurR-regulated permease PerM